MDYIASDNQEQRFMRVFLRVYPIVFFFLSTFCAQTFGQDLNPTVIKAKILQGDTYTVLLPSSSKIEVLSEENIDGGSTET